jgi:hypothetical protein
MSNAATAVISTVVGALLGAGGVLAGKLMDRELYEHQSKVQDRKALIDKRISLIEAYSSGINRSDYASILDGWMLKIGEIGPKVEESCRNENQSDFGFFKCLSDGVILPNLEYRRQISEINSSFVSSVQMANLLFGPKVSESLQKMKDSEGMWWRKGEAVHRAVLDSMREELYIVDLD